MEKESILALTKKTTKSAQIIPAFSLCQEKFGTGVTSGIFLVILSSISHALPISPNTLLKAIKKVIPQKYLELNLKTFDLAKDYEKK
jgi:Pyruvate/2-oxoacid:ferredoxin oxidoreductase gamma subunit